MILTLDLNAGNLSFSGRLLPVPIMLGLSLGVRIANHVVLLLAETFLVP